MKVPEKHLQQCLYCTKDRSAHTYCTPVQVSDEFKLVTETLYLTISYIDRFLSKRSIDNSDFQLLGVSCMCLASKYEEIHPPQLEKLSYITDYVCTEEAILDGEAEVLQTLQYRLSTPTAKVCSGTLCRHTLCHLNMHSMSFANQVQKKFKFLFKPCNHSCSCLCRHSCRDTSGRLMSPPQWSTTTWRRSRATF